LIGFIKRLFPEFDALFVWLWRELRLFACVEVFVVWALWLRGLLAKETVLMEPLFPEFPLLRRRELVQVPIVIHH
jgi:hypothetical protein